MNDSVYSIFNMLVLMNNEIILLEKLIAAQALYQIGNRTEEEKEEYAKFFKTTVDRPFPEIIGK